MNEYDITKFIVAQLNNFFPTKNNMRRDTEIINDVLRTVFERYLHCASKIKAFKGDESVDPYNVLKYPIFLYFLMNTIYTMSINDPGRIKDRLYCLNKYLHGCSIFYKIILPPVFFTTYASQIVLANTKYGDFFLAYQGVTVGSFKDQAPIIGGKVILMPNVIVSGSSIVGDNVVISTGVRVINQNIPDNTIVFQGRGNSLAFKENNGSYFSEFFYA
jgi:serine O-acetyltransferase